MFFLKMQFVLFFIETKTPEFINCYIKYINYKITIHKTLHTINGFHSLWWYIQYMYTSHELQITTLLQPVKFNLSLVSSEVAYRIMLMRQETPWLMQVTVGMLWKQVPWLHYSVDTQGIVDSILFVLNLSPHRIRHCRLDHAQKLLEMQV